MSSWSYRIVHYKNGGYGLHEVYYTDDGAVNGWTADPIDFACDEDEGANGVLEGLKLALEDAIRWPVLEEADLPQSANP
jgi:hypothetical protein